MANWAADWELRNPELAGKPLLRHRHGITAVQAGGVKVSHFVGSPAHWQDEHGVWQPLDTTLQLIGTEYGAPGLATRIATDGTVRIDGQTHGHRSTRVGIFRPSDMSFAAYRTIPDGHVDGDRIIAENGIWKRVLTLTETGLREEIVIAEKPSIPGVKLTDWLVLETQIAGSTFPDGWLDEFETSEVRFPPPQAHDANGDRAECKRYARTVGGVQYLYTGVPVAWLADAAYPVVIDPDYAESTNDGEVNGYNATYATARSTSADYSTIGTTLTVGQYSTFMVYRGFLKFDTSAIPNNDIISQTNLKLVCTNDYSGTNFDVQIVKQDWSGQDPLSAANREAAYDGCLAGTQDDNIWRNTNGMSTNTVYTSGDLAIDWPSKIGSTYYSLRSSRDAAGTQNSGDEYIFIATQSHATGGYRPLLAITHAAGRRRMLLGVGW